MFMLLINDDITQMTYATQWLRVLCDFSSQKITQIIHLCDLCALKRLQGAGER